MSKYTDIYNQVLAVLYSLKSEKEIGFFNLLDILIVLDYPTTQREIYSIAHYLEAKGYVTAKFEIEGIFISLEPQGIAYIEDKEDIFTKILAEKPLSNSKDKIAKFSEDKLTKPRLNLITLMDKVIKTLKSSKITKGTDAVYDAEILKIEFQKLSPDKTVIETKLEVLLQITNLFKEERSKLREAIYAQ
jgi:hypothetical protein